MKRLYAAVNSDMILLKNIRKSYTTFTVYGSILLIVITFFSTHKNASEIEIADALLYIFYIIYDLIIYKTHLQVQVRFYKIYLLFIIHARKSTPAAHTI